MKVSYRALFFIPMSPESVIAVWTWEEPIAGTVVGERGVFRSFNRFQYECDILADILCMRTFYLQYRDIE